jgi:hypothetical protein
MVTDPLPTSRSWSIGPMRYRGWVAVVTVASIVTAGVAACTGDDPPFLAPNSDAGGNDGDTTFVDSSTTDAADASPNTDGGGTTDRCDEARDSYPCGCGPQKSCCAFEDSGICQDRGNEDPDAGCTSLNTIRCLGANCGGGRVCCFHGQVTAGAACPKRMTLFDTECNDVDANDPTSACTDTSSGVKHYVMCQADDDCTPYDAGTCQSARMEGLGRVMGICLH